MQFDNHGTKPLRLVGIIFSKRVDHFKVYSEGYLHLIFPLG
jgi:hypothetical protein